MPLKMAFPVKRFYTSITVMWFSFSISIHAHLSVHGLITTFPEQLEGMRFDFRVQMKEIVVYQFKSI